MDNYLYAKIFKDKLLGCEDIILGNFARNTCHNAMPSHLAEYQKITNENLSITFLCDVANGGTNRQTNRQTNKWQ